LIDGAEPPGEGSARPARGARAIGMIRLLMRLFLDDHGQDLIEYGLLAGIVGIAGVTAMPVIVDHLSTAYQESISGASELWEPCPPAPAACP
jgi:Flp pilus assembly pilin Flp